MEQNRIDALGAYIALTAARQQSVAAPTTSGKA
jgi:hypothetical protein